MTWLWRDLKILHSFVKNAIASFPSIRCISLQQSFYPCQYFVKTIFDFLIVESYNLDFHHVNDVCSEYIMILPIAVNLAIDLHYQFPFMAKEIGDEESLLAQIIEEKRILPVELQPQKLSVAHGLPENLLGVGLTLPQIFAISRKRWLLERLMARFGFWVVELIPLPPFSW